MKNVDERIKKITRTSSIITGLIISVYGYIMYLVTLVDERFRIVIVSAFIAITFIVVFFGRDKIFNTILKVLWNSKNKKIFGQWDIYIFFNDNEKYDRTGTLYFEDTYAGLYIKGDNLTDDKGNQTVEKWFSQEAEVHHFTDNRIILVYQYWLQDDATKDTYSKLGIVTAISDDGGNCFNGTFKDITLDGGKVTREGKVRINKCDPNVVKRG
jgi:hypothetical protein